MGRAWFLRSNRPEYHVAIPGKDGPVMRLTEIGPEPLRRLVLVLAALTLAVGCQKLPYIDQSKPAPHDDSGLFGVEDSQVHQSQFLSQAAVALPNVAPPRTTDHPEAEEIWELTLQQSINIALQNSEVVRVISLGAQGIPIGGFEPTPLNTGAGAGVASALGAGTLSTVYDPAIQETGIASALSSFDTAFTTSLLWGQSSTPLNNAITAGVLGAGRFPVIFDQQQAQYQVQLAKRTADGTQITIAHNINWLYTNSPINVFPSAYTTNMQFQMVKPLLGSAPLPNQAAPPPAGMEANRAPIVIARINADAAVWRFKAEVMAMARSVEQQYWALAQQHMALWSRETAFGLNERIFNRVQAEKDVGRKTDADLAEAEQQLERSRFDLVSATSDVITTERQLRNILGLPPADNRRIIPVTAPTEARLVPDWESSLAQLVTFQPDIVQQQLLTRIAELQLLVARNQLLPVLNLNALYQLNGLGNHLDGAEGVMTGASLNAINPSISTAQSRAGLISQPVPLRDFVTWQVGFTFQMPLGMRAPMANVKNAQYTLLRQKAFLQQVVHQTTHSLARFFLEVDANYKLFKSAGRSRAAAAVRLKTQQAVYEVGRLTVDRYLDSVSQWAAAVAQEAQSKTSYNISIVALEEAKGTLLAYDNIAVSEGPHPSKAYIQARDQQAGHRFFPIRGDGPYKPVRGSGPPVPDPVVPQPVPGVNQNPVRPPLPAPGGNLPPFPPALPPAATSGEANVLSSNTNKPAVGSGGTASAPAIEPAVRRASVTAAAASNSPSTSGRSTTPPTPDQSDLPPLPDDKR